MSEAKGRLKELLRELVAVNAVSGFEYYIIGKIIEKIKPYADEVTIDPLGNVVAVKKGAKPGPSLLVVAHTDEIGLLIKNILPDGFLLFEKIGGVPDNMLLGRKVYIGKDNIPGIIGTKPGHLQTPDEAIKVRPAAQCYIDVGCSSRAEVEKLGLRVGDQAVWHSDFLELANPDLVTTKAVDDRMGCAIIIDIFQNLKAEDFGGTLYGGFSIREEMGLFGVPVMGAALNPDYAIALDTIPAGDTPDVNTARDLPIYLGKGPALPLAAGVGYSFASIAHPAVVDILEKQAKQLGINLQTMTLLSATYSTDGEKLAYAGKGIPTGTLAIPRRYSHSPIELVNMNDATDVLRILEAIVANNHSADLRFYKA